MLDALRTPGYWQRAGVMAEGEMAALTAESLCFCPEEVKRSEAWGNVYICPEKARSQTPTPSSSLIKHFLIFLYKMESKPILPNTPSLVLLEQCGCLGYLHLGPRWRRQVTFLPLLNLGFGGAGS